MSKIQPDDTMSPMMKSFIKQSNLDDSEANLRDIALSEWQQKQYDKAKSQLQRSGDVILNIINKQTGVNNKSEIHPNMRNYNHGLEIDRRQLCDIKDGRVMADHDDGVRPVERNGIIEYECTLTMDQLLEKT